jgi:uncharacterized protein DUF397
MGPDVYGANWRKASYSMANGNCVEAVSAATHIAVRDSVNPGATVLSYSSGAWRAFIAEVKAGSFDPLAP